MYLLRLLVLILVVIFGFSDGYNVLSDIDEWKSFKREHSKQYDSLADEIHHFRIFVEHKHTIAHHNMHHDNGIASFEMGFNKYSDLTHEQFTKHMKGLRRNPNDEDNDNDGDSYFHGAHNTVLPKTVDWRLKGAVSLVKDQSRCGSCWTFSATGSVESHYFIRTGHLVSLSEQNLVDCSRPYGNHGCEGGYPSKAFQYMRDHGIGLETNYPYHHIDQQCTINSTNSAIKIKGTVYIPSGDERKLQEALATVGPVAVLIDASNESFDHYKSGIYYEPNCNPFNLDHAVLAVGYGTDEFHRDYYIIKNSWGPTWGENGYIRMTRNHMNHCGIATQAVYPEI